jgi:hypothetical protein
LTKEQLDVARRLLAEERQESLRCMTEAIHPAAWPAANELFKAVFSALRQTVRGYSAPIPFGTVSAVLRIAADELERVGGR